MDFSKMTDAQLIDFRDKVQKFHTGIQGDRVILDRSNMQLALQNEPRLNDLLRNLFTEAHDELCKRFVKDIQIMTTDPTIELPWLVYSFPRNAADDNTSVNKPYRLVAAFISNEDASAYAAEFVEGDFTGAIIIDKRNTGTSIR